MKSFCLSVGLCALVTACCMATYAYTHVAPVWYVWSFVCFLVYTLGTYGYGFFSGWNFSHTLERTVYRHER